MPGFFEFGHFRLYPSQGRLERDGAAVEIAPLDFKLLVSLAERGASGARRDELVRGLAPESDPRALQKRVSNLRTIIGKEAIQTGPDLGYFFRAPVQWIDTGRAIPAPARRPNHAIRAVAGVLLLGAVAYWAWSRKADEPPATANWRVTPVTATGGSEALAVFSRTGDRLAFCWNGENEGPFQIYIRAENNGALRQFTSDEEFHHYSPAWSPDGRSLAFARVGPGTAEVCAGPADGSRSPSCTLTAFPARAEVPGRQLDWSPDGKFLAVVDKASSREPFRIFRAEVDASGIRSEKTPVTNPLGSVVGDTSPAISPDGRTLVFTRVFSQGMRDLFALDLRSGQETKLTNYNRYIAGVSWMPDGREVVFSSDRLGGLRLWKMRVFPSPGEATAVGPAGNAVHPAVRSDGAIIYSEFQVNTDIERLDLASGKMFPAAFNSTMQDSSPNSAPDGRVAFASDRSGAFEIWVTDNKGGNPQQLTSIGGLGAGSPRWSPDGKRIVFDSRMAGDPNIYVIEPGAPGAKPRQITTDKGSDVVPSWSRDGKYLYYSSTRAGGPRHDVWKIPVAGTEADARQITFSGGFAPFESKDGQYVYYARGRSEGGLMRVPVASGKEEPVLDGPPAGYWAYWTPGSGGIYFLEPGAAPDKGPGFDFAIDFISPLAGATVRFRRFDNNQPETIAVLQDIRLAFLPGLTLSHDEKSLLLPRVQRSGADLKRLENY